MNLAATCLTRDQANAYIKAHHRHHGGVSGHRFIVGAMLDDMLVGVAVAGRPRARLIDQYRNLEVTRLCSAGDRNTCSFLYSRCSRVALDRKLEVIGAPDEDLEPGYIMLVTPEASICVLASDLRRALKVFE